MPKHGPDNIASEQKSAPAATLFNKRSSQNILVKLVTKAADIDVVNVYVRSAYVTKKPELKNNLHLAIIAALENLNFTVNREDLGMLENLLILQKSYFPEERSKSIYAIKRMMNSAFLLNRKKEEVRCELEVKKLFESCATIDDKLDDATNHFVNFLDELKRSSDNAYNYHSLLIYLFYRSLLLLHEINSSSEKKEDCLTRLSVKTFCKNALGEIEVRLPEKIRQTIHTLLSSITKELHSSNVTPSQLPARNENDYFSRGYSESALDPNLISYIESLNSKLIKPKDLIQEFSSNHKPCCPIM